MSISLKELKRLEKSSVEKLDVELTTEAAIVLTMSEPLAIAEPKDEIRAELKSKTDSSSYDFLIPLLIFAPFIFLAGIIGILLDRGIKMLLRRWFSAKKLQY